ncbi:ABC transporter ATP-binding protein [Streptomyces inusitatus]|uniref:ABC transporter ATP-binding protein n=1 Tax=Streptomyces inusitatus TaxID=68221 RepID=A0A918UZS5_9ACTN|nr:ABC transporter ATP-binding protein [Streptomyces inusitatus]GGZ50235.1 ABC transporter ATP-binding protein [Streptomyces inusitatus]
MTAGPSAPAAENTGPPAPEGSPEQAVSAVSAVPAVSPVLDVRELRKSYGDLTALDGVDLRVAAGEIVSLLGPNGAGKSTFVSIVAGLRRADSGSVEVAGVDAAADPGAARRMTGLVPQDLGVYPPLSTRRNLRLFGELAGLRGRELGARIGEVSRALSIETLLDRPVGELSGGQKRRAHTAMALLHRPRLLLLDEVTAGADIESRARLLDVVRELAADGSAVVYSTHYLQEVETLGASVALLEAGTVIARGSVRELVAGHSTPTVEFRFAGPAPLAADGRGHEGFAERDGGVLRVTTRDPAATIATTVLALGEDAGRLRGVEIVEPSLETVYLALTGRRYASGETLS